MEDVSNLPMSLGDAFAEREMYGWGNLKIGQKGPGRDIGNPLSPPKGSENVYGLKEKQKGVTATLVEKVFDNFFSDNFNLKTLKPVRKRVVSKKEINLFKSAYRPAIRIKKRNAHNKYIRRASNKQAAMRNVIKANGVQSSKSHSSTLNANNLNFFFVSIDEAIIAEIPATQSKFKDFIQTNQRGRGVAKKEQKHINDKRSHLPSVSYADFDGKEPASALFCNQ
ncbi:unnamed protein product [Acanthoscelides obtectus]|uniref:Uncharacterized protein n=1 Tax=Acanthoscelides obtectus TaxID=200917 RepID=A0A9P0Q2T8_ACAOB|nr:unnamed protein product [Acanthoscelides obtectus]CAK1633625.1 hypothetical protein AOBTE_LOCUS8268 [Acanthoscelides obtectus]